MNLVLQNRSSIHAEQAGKIVHLDVLVGLPLNFFVLTEMNNPLNPLNKTVNGLTLESSANDAVMVIVGQYRRRKPAVLPNFHVCCLRHGPRSQRSHHPSISCYLTLVLNQGCRGRWSPSWKPLSRGTLERPPGQTQQKT